MAQITTLTDIPDWSATYPSLKDKRVFITGGGSGIGASLVEGFARQGARVAFVDVADAAATTLVEKIKSKNHPAPWYQHCDVTDVSQLQRIIRDAAAALGDFNVLINNVASDDRHATLDVTPEYWDRRMAINQRPAFFAIQSVLPGMQKLGGGSIINIGSTGWQTKTSGYPAYATAKSSVMGLTRGLAKELGAHRIRINVVSPGWVMTERQLQLWAVPDMDKEIARNQCTPDPLQPPDITSMVLFLASDDARGCTAQEFIVDSGWS
ncbi:MAG TPA: SDR family oxidoreductase [Steroidobacteraceae bacterium]|nr:SDR family oxidoreductase [Steroidobacteraceae bacterium]